MDFDTELLHALPVTITLDNENINGVDWELDGDPLVLVEGKARLTAADGTVAYGFHERSALRSRLTRVQRGTTAKERWRGPSGSCYAGT